MEREDFHSSSQLGLFFELPYEIILYMMDFLVDSKLSDLSNERIKENIRMMMIFQYLNTKLNSIEGIRNYSDEFWWQLFVKGYGKIIEDREEMMMEMKQYLIQNNCMRRKILCLRYFLPKTNLFIPTRYKAPSGITIALFGRKGVGMKALSSKYKEIHCNSLSYSPAESTVGRRMEFYGRKYMVTIRDEGLEETEYRCFKFPSSIAIFICSVDDMQSLTDLNEWCEKWVDLKSERNEFPIIFSINKVDLDPNRNQLQICHDYIQELIKKYDLTNTLIMETSAVTGQNVVEVIEERVVVVHLKLMFDRHNQQSILQPKMIFTTNMNSGQSTLIADNQHNTAQSLCLAVDSAL